MTAGGKPLLEKLEGYLNSVRRYIAEGDPERASITAGVALKLIEKEKPQPKRKKAR